MRINRNDRPTLARRAAAAGAVALLFAASPAGAQTAGAVAAAEPAPAPSQVEKKPAPKSLNAWRSKVLAHLNQHKRAVAGADTTSSIAFGIDRSGKVLSARVVTSSGNAALDEEAVALTQRASPVPAPPADLSGSPLYLKVPIRFAR